MRNETLGCNFTPYLVESTRPVMSVGIKCMDEGYDFVWRAGKEKYFQKPDGARIRLTVRDYVPYVPSKVNKAMPCKSRSRPVVDAGVRADAFSSNVMRGVVMMMVGEKRKKLAGRLSRPTGRSSRQRMILTLLMMPWTIRHQDPRWQKGDRVT